MEKFPKKHEFPEIRGGIGMKHLPGHKDECHWKFSFYFIPGAGRFEGETSERRWSIDDLLREMTQQMGSGHRRDTMAYHNNDFNIQKVFKIGTQIVAASVWFPPGLILLYSGIHL